MSGVGQALPSNSAGTPTHTGAPTAAPVASPAHLSAQAAPAVVPIASLTPQTSAPGSNSGSSITAASAAAANRDTAVHQRNGEAIYLNMEKINSELLSMTYGAMVRNCSRHTERAIELSCRAERGAMSVMARSPVGHDGS